MTELLSDSGTRTGTVAADPERVRGRGARRLARRIAGIERVLTWTGLLVTAAGFVLIAIAWGEVAARTAVALQMPWVISAGVTGLGVVLVGVTLVAIDAKLADARARAEQALELATRLQALVEKETRR